MGARRQTIDPLSETPFWRTPAFRYGCIAAGVLGIIGITVYLVRENRRHQIEWRLEEDPRLSGIKRELVSRIAKARPGDTQAPRALWLGRINRVAETAASTTEAPSVLVVMESPSLMAGTRGKNDSEPLNLSAQGFTFSPAKPRAGETWMIAVRRDKDDRSIICSANRAELK